MILRYTYDPERKAVISMMTGEVMSKHETLDDAVAEIERMNGLVSDAIYEGAVNARINQGVLESKASPDAPWLPH